MCIHNRSCLVSLPAALRPVAILTGLSWLCVRATSDALHVDERNDAGRKRLQGAETLPLIEDTFSGQKSVHVAERRRLDGSNGRFLVSCRFLELLGQRSPDSLQHISGRMVFFAMP